MTKRDLKIVLIVLSCAASLFSIPIYYSIKDKQESKRLKDSFVVVKGFVVSSEASRDHFRDNAVRFEYIYDDCVYLSDRYHFNSNKPLPIGFPALFKVSTDNPAYSKFIVDTIVYKNENTYIKYINKFVGGWTYEEVIKH